MSAPDARARRLPALADRWSPTRNSFGLLRLVLVLGVVVSHSWPIGFAAASPGAMLSAGQTELGSMSLFGLLVVSGFLNTGSGLHLRARTFLWHRFLRIFPGFWVCLVVTALVFAPVAALLENGTLRGFWGRPDGPLHYVARNWFLSMDQFTISGLLADTPFGRMTGGPSGFDGSLWSLRYEFGCYLVLAVLIATGVLRRARWVTMVLAILLWAVLLRQLVNSPTWTMIPFVHGVIGPLPLVGTFELTFVVYLGFLFLLGTLGFLYRQRIPMHGGLAILAALVLAITCWRGGLFVLGLPAYAYLLLYAAVALPERVTRFGRTRDYSYGVYIYAFPVQQLVSLAGGNRHGLPAYLTLCLAVTFAAAAASWHLVERPALGLKRRGKALPQRDGRPRPAPTPTLRSVPDAAAIPENRGSHPGR